MPSHARDPRELNVVDMGTISVATIVVSAEGKKE